MSENDEAPTPDIESVLTDVMGRLDPLSEEPVPAVLVVLVGNELHMHVRGDLPQVEAMSQFVAKQVRIAQLRSELQALEGA